MLPSREPGFFFSRIEVHGLVINQKLYPRQMPLRVEPSPHNFNSLLCADVILSFRTLKSVFQVKKQTLYAPLVRTRFSFSRFKIHVFGHKLDTLYSTRTDPFAETMIIQNLYSQENVFFFFCKCKVNKSSCFILSEHIN